MAVSEYSLDQAADLAQIAVGAIAEAPDCGYRNRNTLYLSLLSIELALKAALEKAGMPASEIRQMNHRLYELHRVFVDRCSYQYLLGVDKPPQVGRGAALLDIVVTINGEYLTFGRLMHGTTWESFATYPAQLRYGDGDQDHFPAEVVAQMAAKLCEWLGKRFGTLSLNPM